MTTNSGGGDEDRELEDLAVVLPALLRAVEALGFIARYLHPPDLGATLEVAGRPDDALRTVRSRLDAWRDRLSGPRDALATAADAVLAGFAGLRAADDLRAVFRAMRWLPRAQEALYSLAADLPPVGRAFLDPALRTDAARIAALAGGRRTDTGVRHVDNQADQRGGFSVYVPEDYDPGRAWPLVMALHGGAGHGRSFLWSWLAAARSKGAILVAPTAMGDTWALAGDDVDTPNLLGILETVQSGWRIDPDRMLLSGMSDGGTFCYVSGLEPGSPFTHLAPVAAAFHPFLAEMADPDRLRGLPIHIVHGALDWMFPVDAARTAQRALSAAGARVTYAEIADLSHTYPREMNGPILDWLRDAASPALGGYSGSPENSGG